MAAVRSSQVEESRLRGDGSKVVTKQGRQALARVSVLDGRSSSETTAPVIMDDYVVQSEPVVDHLTRFSGITPGPGRSYGFSAPDSLFFRIVFRFDFSACFPLFPSPLISVHPPCACGSTMVLPVRV